jgi:tungstate transport system substrate-binding protein
MRVVPRLVTALALAAGIAHAAELRVGATHSLQDSGILAVLVSAFEAASGVKVRPLVAGTGQVLKYAEQGDVDVVFTHSPVDEERLVARGIGKSRIGVMHNDFVIVGPAADPAHVRGVKDAAASLRRIREAGARFVSRGDDSGTHKKELQLWQASSGFVPWRGYLASGQGAARTLMMAHELDAYAIADRATYRQLGRRVSLGVMVEGDARLRNEYGVITLAPRPGLRPNEADAERFAAWLASREGRRAIEGYRIEGEPVFRAGPAR